MIIPDKNCQTIVGIPRSEVENFRISVKKIIEIPRLAHIIKGLIMFGLLFSVLARLPPTITGSNVNVQGAAIVKAPAKKDKINSVTGGYLFMKLLFTDSKVGLS